MINPSERARGGSEDTGHLSLWSCRAGRSSTSEEDVRTSESNMAHALDADQRGELGLREVAQADACSERLGVGVPVAHRVRPRRRNATAARSDRRKKLAKERPRLNPPPAVRTFAARRSLARITVGCGSRSADGLAGGGG
jgi:hypothetical protein